MANPEFTSDEIAAFEAWFDAAETWRSWYRRKGTHGEDVIEISPKGDRYPPVKIAKTQTGYAATGFDGWGLTVCDAFDELLGILATWRPVPWMATERAA